MGKHYMMAFDASVRTIDDNGHLRVAKTVISKAQVDPYYGREIPGWEELGLDSDKIYNLLRCPEELQKAADSFKGKQLLIKHVPVDSRKPEKELTIGAIGSDISFEDGKLYADLTAWDEQGISLIESGKMKELSAGYAYTPDMTPGEFEGTPYDGVMRDISGNHVALVERGRIGADAVISDSLPFEMRLQPMKLKKGAGQLITARLRKIAQDGISEDSTEELIREVAENIEHKPAFDEEKLRELAGDNYEKIVELLGAKAEDEDKAEAEDEQTQAERDNESEAMRLKEREERERRDRERDRREAEDEGKHAMDAASIAADVEARINAKYTARDAVEPLVGRIAMDGFADAKEIYAYALKQKGIATDGINEAGLKALVAMQRETKAAPAVAMDSAQPSTLTARFKRGI